MSGDICIGSEQLAVVIPLFPDRMFVPSPTTRWERLRNRLPLAVAEPRATAARKIAAHADALHRLASRLCDELPADPAAARAEVLIEYVRAGGDVAALTVPGRR